MTYLSAWEEIYAAEHHMSVWPWSDMVAFVMRHARPEGQNFNVLELGCGAGANIPFFQSLGVKYSAIDGSQTAIETLRRRLPQIAGNLIVGDFAKSIPLDGPFDAVVDRASVTHNPTSAIRATLRLVLSKLRPGGCFIGIDWFSTEFSEYTNGIEDEDAYTRRDFREGKLADTGMVHFADRAHIYDLFSDFEIVVLEHKVVRQYVPPEDWQFAAWNLVARKKA